MRREFLALCLSKLIPGGGITITTDFERYFEFIREEVQGLAESSGGFEYKEAEGPGIVMTNFSRKHLELGGKIYRMEMRKGD